MNKLRGLADVLPVSFRPATAQTVVNWRTGAPFVTYRTYAWQDSTNPGMPFYGQWVKADVLAQLHAKGLMPARPGQTPDLLVYHLQGQEVMDTSSHTDSDGFGWGPWDKNSTTFTSEHPPRNADFDDQHG